MGLDNGMRSAGSEPKKRLSTRWIITLVVLIIANLFVWQSGNFGVLASSLFSVLTVIIIASGKFARPYQRLAYILVVPGLLAWILAAHVFYAAFTTGYSGTVIRFLQRIAGGENGQITLAILLGLLVGILISIGFLEGYVFMHQATIQAFSGLDAKAARQALRTLVLNMNHAYFIIDNGQSVTSRPPGVFPKWGGPGMGIIHPGNAVVFQQGGEFTTVELSGIYRTKTFEKIYKIINLTPRDNLSIPKQPALSDSDVPLSSGESGGESRPERNAHNILTRDRIPLDLDLKVFFQIKRKKEPEQDPTLLAFSSEQSRDFLEAYLVDKDDVFKAATSTTNWELAVGAVAEDILRDTVGQNNLDELFQAANSENKLPKIRGEICEEIQKKLNAVVGDWGIQVTFLSIGEIDIPTGVQEQLQEQWVTEKQRDILITKSQA